MVLVRYTAALNLVLLSVLERLTNVSVGDSSRAACRTTTETWGLSNCAIAITRQLVVEAIFERRRRRDGQQDDSSSSEENYPL
jgi:hypothetical protein